MGAQARPGRSTGAVTKSKAPLSFSRISIAHFSEAELPLRSGLCVPCAAASHAGLQDALPCSPYEYGPAVCDQKAQDTKSRQDPEKLQYSRRKEWGLTVPVRERPVGRGKLLKRPNRWRRGSLRILFRGVRNTDARTVLSGGASKIGNSPEEAGRRSTPNPKIGPV